MSMQADLMARLLADAGVSALVATRIYADVAPQGAALPYITTQVISTAHTHHLAGGSRVAQSRVQIDVWASAASSREAIAEAIRQSLMSHVGELVASGTWAHHIAWDGPANDILDPEHGTERGVFRGMCEAMVTYQTAALT